MNKAVIENRSKFLDALRSGNYKKGTIKSDDKGYPIINSETDNDGYCACAVMVDLFPKDGKPNYTFARKQLAVTGKDCLFIQTQLNDTDLNFNEIADAIESKIFSINKKINHVK